MKRLVLMACAYFVAPALAQQRPEPVPRMDVQVIYATTQPDAPGAPPGETRIAFHAGLGVFRIDPPAVEGASAVYILSHRGADRAMMVMEARRGWLELEPGATLLRELEVALASGRAVRQGVARHADIPCTIWRLPEPTLGTACVSRRGVLLRRESPAGALLEATTVEVREQEAERFVPPAGYRAVTSDEMFAAPR